MFAIAYDMIRLFLGPTAITPRGIDRVDLSYARYFAEQWPGDFGGTLPTPWGFRWYDRDYVLGWLGRLERHWRETVPAEADPAFGYVKQRLGGKPGPPRAWRRPGWPVRVRDVLKVSGVAAGQALRQSAPRDCIYLNVGQIGLAMAWLLDWLQSRPDVKPVFMLHDVIPIASPQFVSARATRFHRKMMNNAARFGAGMITTTHAARDGILAELGPQCHSAIPVTMSPLPVAPGFLQSNPRDRELQEFNYFVVCGSIEPRKNHLLLLDVWRDLVAEHGKAAPKLLILGAPGWGAEKVLREVQHSATTCDHIILVTGLSTSGLRNLVSHARGLLMPSFAEGFGLPVVEALALGTPVIASDLPSHRETGGTMAVYHSPTDRLGWLREIERHAFDDSAHEMRRRITALHRPITAPEYFAKIVNFLEAVKGHPRSRAAGLHS